VIADRGKRTQVGIRVKTARYPRTWKVQNFEIEALALGEGKSEQKLGIRWRRQEIFREELQAKDIFIPHAFPHSNKLSRRMSMLQLDVDAAKYFLKSS